jgi:hypothetical protein
MAVERIRKLVTGKVKPEELLELQNAGWRAVAVEWEREVPARQLTGLVPEPIPFGLRVASDCKTLESQPEESETLVAMMELIIQDGPYSAIADELNRRGYHTREGSKWTAVSIFQMLPRLIEAGPIILSSEEWERRKRLPANPK